MQLKSVVPLKPLVGRSINVTDLKISTRWVVKKEQFLIFRSSFWDHVTKRKLHNEKSSCLSFFLKKKNFFGSVHPLSLSGKNDVLSRQALLLLIFQC